MAFNITRLFMIHDAIFLDLEELWQFWLIGPDCTVGFFLLIRLLCCTIED